MTTLIREMIGNNWIFKILLILKKSTKIALINFRHLFLGENDVIIGKMTGKSMQ